MGLCGPAPSSLWAPPQRGPRPLGPESLGCRRRELPSGSDSPSPSHRGSGQGRASVPGAGSPHSRRAVPSSPHASVPRPSEPASPPPRPRLGRFPRGREGAAPAAPTRSLSQERSAPGSPSGGGPPLRDPAPPQPPVPAASAPRAAWLLSELRVSCVSSQTSRRRAFVRNPGQGRPSRPRRGGAGGGRRRPREQPLCAQRHVGQYFHFKGAAPASALCAVGVGAGLESRWQAGGGVA